MDNFKTMSRRQQVDVVRNWATQLHKWIREGKKGTNPVPYYGIRIMRQINRIIVAHKI